MDQSDLDLISDLLDTNSSGPRENCLHEIWGATFPQQRPPHSPSECSSGKMSLSLLHPDSAAPSLSTLDFSKTKTCLVSPTMSVSFPSIPSLKGCLVGCTGASTSNSEETETCSRQRKNQDRDTGGGCLHFLPSKVLPANILGKSGLRKSIELKGMEQRFFKRIEITGVFSKSVLGWWYSLHRQNIRRQKTA